MLKLIVFDCDGVLFDSRESNRQFYNHLLRHFGKPPMTEEECDFAHIHSTMDAIAYIFRHYPELDLQEVDRFRLTCDYGPFLQMLQVERDLITFLDTVHPHYHLAISTNRTNTIEPLLQKFELRHYFGKVMTAQNAKRPKPAPDALLEILSHYDCRPDESIYIGDSTIDQLHAGSCSVPFIAFKNRSLDAAYHVNGFMEILTLSPFTGHHQVKDA
ncbi:MAG: HAD family hydrolase [Desulfoprunum sp.]|jgi:phosphoglycolate phosphatase|uniref:HAD family hydrolase n=1 Tax=Desulfoprunum sp. TaxID=2020866 RepID=UPI003C780913